MQLEPAKLPVLGKDYVSISVAFSNLFLLHNLTNLIKFSLFLNISVLKNIHSFIPCLFLSIQLLKELSYPFHLTYNLSPFLFIIFSTLNSVLILICILSFVILFCKTSQQLLLL